MIVLEMLLFYLGRVMDHRSKNGVDMSNLCYVMMPLWFQAKEASSDAMNDHVALREVINKLVESRYWLSFSRYRGYKVSLKNRVPAMALYDYQSKGNKNSRGEVDISLVKGEMVTLMEEPRNNGWALIQKPVGIGLVPVSYIKRCDAEGKIKISKPTKKEIERKKERRTLRKSRKAQAEAESDASPSISRTSSTGSLQGYMPPPPSLLQSNYAPPPVIPSISDLPPLPTNTSASLPPPSLPPPSLPPPSLAPPSLMVPPLSVPSSAAMSIPNKRESGVVNPPTPPSMGMFPRDVPPPIKSDNKALTQSAPPVKKSTPAPEIDYRQQYEKEKKIRLELEDEVKQLKARIAQLEAGGLPPLPLPNLNSLPPPPALLPPPPSLSLPPPLQ
eukprot:TRINITY_DN3173_c0_g1_i3.p2 TRINITY_DN3173_c0_g1~~TRINITY_DN3173_c0_g1_i3.p2  ORF type:complete len:387 (+),score=106.20 TRINITY_DN3173_c0_g1_i3:1317-2477(+)